MFNVTSLNLYGFVKKLLITLLLIGVLATCYANSKKESNQVDKEKQRITVQKATVVNNTHLVAQGLASLLENQDYEQQIQTCRDFIRKIRFFDDNSGYFYVYNTKGENIAHAYQPEKEGKDLSGLKDSKGKLIVMATIEGAQKGGEFISIYFENPLTKVEEEKLVYAEMIPGTDFLIGSGVYIGKH